MKKLFLGISLICLLVVLAPFFAQAAGLVPCDGVNVKCTWDMVKVMLQGILNFIVLDIAVPLAVLALTIGGIILLTSAGNPKMSGLGKQIVISAVIGLFLALCSSLIINFVLNAIGAGSYQVETPSSDNFNDID